MKRLAILIHGLNVPSGGIGKLRCLKDELSEAGFEISEFKYGYTQIFGALRRNRTIAVELAKQIDKAYEAYDEVVVLGHSNGCAIMELAANQIKKCDMYVYIAAALYSYSTPYPAVSKTDVWFNPRDGIIKLAEIGRHIPQWMFKRLQWGRMGLTGYQGYDASVRNHVIRVFGINCKQQHSAFFFDNGITNKKIVSSILSRLEEKK